MTSKAIIIGAGIGGLGTACLLAKGGYDVTIIEKNEQVGGRGSVFRDQGFSFDMGPSWYLMPDLFEQFYALLGEDIHQHLDLVRLDPSYKVWFGKNRDREPMSFSSNETEAMTQFEKMEPGVTSRLKAYMQKAKAKYEIAKDGFMAKNYDSILDMITWKSLTKGMQLGIFSSFEQHVSQYTQSDHVKKILQYSMVFLGSSPYDTPSMYSMMSHIDFELGVFYPMGGMNALMQSLGNIAKKHGVKVLLNSPVKQILVDPITKSATGVCLENGTQMNADLIISNADYYHTETKMLAPEYQQFTKKYWNTRQMAPSALILYLGVRGKCEALEHHNLYFAKDWKKGFAEVFDHPQWPSDPSLYICAPSKTDPSVAPPDHENLFVLVPISPDLPMTKEDELERAEEVIEMMQRVMDVPDLKERIVYQKIFSGNDFKDRYNSFKGSALGLAHPLRQTAYFRPNTKSKKVKNLYYVGAGTNPGIGVPICLISAQLVYKRLIGDTSGDLLTSNIFS